MLLEGVHHQADGVFVRGRDVQNGEAGLGDALLVDLHALNDGPNRACGSHSGGEVSVRGNPVTDSPGTGRADHPRAVEMKGSPIRNQDRAGCAPLAGEPCQSPSGTTPHLSEDLANGSRWAVGGDGRGIVRGGGSRRAGSSVLDAVLGQVVRVLFDDLRGRERCGVVGRFSWPGAVVGLYVCGGRGGRRVWR